MFVKKSHHTEVEVAIRTSLNAYADENDGAIDSVTALRNSFILWSIKTNSLIENLSIGIGEKVVTGLAMAHLPEWFGRMYADADVPPWCVEITQVHRMPYQSQVESVSQSNSFSCCCNLLKAVALICFDTQPDNRLLTIWRKNSELVFKRLTVSQLDFAFPLPVLSAVSDLSLLERKAVLFTLLLDGTPGRLLVELPLKWQLVFSSMVYWVRHSHCRIKSYHLDGLMASLIHLSIMEPRIGRIRTLKKLENKINAASTKDDAELSYYLQVAKRTFKLQEADDRMLASDINYDRDVVHVLAEFQAILYMAQTLQRVLDVTDLPSPSASSFYNGTFIHQAVCHFKGHNRLVLAEKLYGPEATSSLFRTFRSYTEMVIELAPPSLMDWSPHGPNRPRKKRNKKPQSSVVADSSPTPSASEVDSTEEIDLIGNRFHLLNVA